jgi:simple sugar transport system permease protein
VNLVHFLTNPWASVWFAGNTLDYTALLVCASIGAAFAFRGGLFNLGLEGQIYLGGLAAACALLFVPGGLAPGLSLGLAAAAAALTGALMGLFCAFLKKTTGANTLITTFLLSSALMPVADFIIAGPLRDSAGSMLATARFSAGLPRILPPSNLSLSFVFSVGLCVTAHIFISRTGAGYRFRIAGGSPAFARYGGIDADSVSVPALGLSGAFGGLCGFFAVAGTYGLCYQGFSGGLGWAGMAVALIARNRFPALLPAALFYATLKSGVDQTLLSSVISINASQLLEALILMLATVKFSRARLLKGIAHGI